MDDVKENLVAVVEADADGARRRAIRLRLLAEYIVGDKDQMLKLADMEDSAAESYDSMARNFRKAWGL